ncbi:hypothetical protein [Pantoea sp. Ap-967]|uniref:hypothetical protein n=1 Tax=Pantoea sp. Ap-967 TaxID=2608362 RepID=UPI0019650C81|nr:hypothetical protein [Pantoea sp. Ap-967]
MSVSHEGCVFCTALQFPLVEQIMTCFSFRADAIQDVFELVLAPGMRPLQRLTILPDQHFPDVEVEIETDMPEGELRRIIAGLEDCHVIADTFLACDLKSNALQRGEDSDPLPVQPEF